MNTCRSKFQASALALLLLAAPAYGAMVMQESTFALSGTTDAINASGSTSKGSGTGVSFQLFDPSLGTLTGARYELQSAMGADAQATVWGNGSTATGATLHALVSAGTEALRGTGGQFIQSQMWQQGSCTVPTDTWTCDISLSFSQAFDASLDATALSELIQQGGESFFSIGISAVMNLSAAPDPATGMLSTGQYAWSDWADRANAGTMRLVFEYTPRGTETVPEPSTVALLGLAFVTALTRSRSGPQVRPAPVAGALA